MSESIHDTIKYHINRNVIQAIETLILTDTIKVETIRPKESIMRALSDDFIESYLNTLKKYGIESVKEIDKNRHILSFELLITPVEFVSLLKLYQLL